jgi:hypothetical protein
VITVFLKWAWWRFVCFWFGVTICPICWDKETVCEKKEHYKSVAKWGRCWWKRCPSVHAVHGPCCNTRRHDQLHANPLGDGWCWRA